MCLIRGPGHDCHAEYQNHVILILNFVGKAGEHTTDDKGYEAKEEYEIHDNKSHKVPNEDHQEQEQNQKEKQKLKSNKFEL